MSSAVAQRRPVVDLELELTSGFAARFIPFKAKQIAGTRGFAAHEREDLEQQLRVCLLERVPEFDPERSEWPVFVTTIVERCVATLILRRRRRLPRGSSGLVSLSELVPGEDGELVERDELVSLEHVEAWTGRNDRDEIEWSDLEMDVAAVLASQPPEVRDVLERLRFHSVAAVARELGVPRTTVWELLSRVRPAFRRAGLKAFLRNLRNQPSASHTSE